MNIVEELAAVPTLRNFAFCPDGHRVARLTDRAGQPTVETCDLRGGTGVHEAGVQRVFGPDAGLFLGSELTFPAENHIRVCLGKDRHFQIVDCRRTSADGSAGRWTAEPIAESRAATVRLLPRLEGSDWDLVLLYAEGSSTICRIEPDRPGLRRLAQVPGQLDGATWLDPGRRLATNLSEPGGKASGYVIDLDHQTYHRIFHVSSGSDDRVVGYDCRQGMLAVTSDCGGYRRVGVADLRSGDTVRFFPDPPMRDRSQDVCGSTGDGRLVLRRLHGVRHELRLADPSELSVSPPLDLPDGLVSQPVIWAADRIRFVFTGPTIPPACASYLPGHHEFRLDESPARGQLSAGDLVTPEVVDFRGPHGTIEALVYEPPATQRRDVVILALHGGPVDQFSAAFTPELQLFAGLGARVVAPNYHGSIGYGHDFVHALEGAAGVVDIDDVTAVAAAVRGGSRRQTTVLYGHSYGGFLGLLAAATHPWLYEAVIAVAPFTSLSSMQTVGTPSVRRLADLLGGRTGTPQETDVLQRCADLRATLLIAHGDQDDVIPIQQSYALCDQLRAHGYRDGQDLWFLPLRADHAISDRPAVLRLYQHIELFLRRISSASPRRSGPNNNRRGQAAPPPCTGSPNPVQLPQERR